MSADNKAPQKGEKKSPAQVHHLRILVVIILVILTVQGWTGDAVNLFAVPPTYTNTVSPSLSGLVQAIQNIGPFLIWHASEGILIFATSLVVLVFSFLWSSKKSVRICGILATLFVLSAGLGGLLFVFSAFSNGGNSAQMGGSFIGSYAFYFMELYFTK